MLAPNTLLQGRYLILCPIGKGGMGTVYQATDTRLRCTVALKQTLLTDKAMRKAFEHEAQLLARLRHPSLPKVSDHFIEDIGQFLVMEFIPGDDLAVLMTRNGGKFPSNDVITWGLRWADQLLDALDYLHTQSPPIIHQDIKPQNLKLTTKGHIILLDFGLARGAASQMVTVTARNTVYIGGFTPNYAPLEQIRGGGPNPHSDLYSLAATLYHLLTGIRPPDALSRAASLLNNQHDLLRPANELNPLVPPAIASVLHSALALNIADRPPSAAAMREALGDTSNPSQPCRSLIVATADGGQPASIVPRMSSASSHLTFTPTPPQCADSSSERLTPNVLTAPGAISPIQYPGRPVGTLLQTLQTGSQILSLAYSPNGQILASGGEDHTISLWQVHSSHLLNLLEQHRNSVRCVAFSSDGRMLASGGEDKTVRLWWVADGSLAHTQHMLTYPTECVAFSPDGRILASGGWGGAIGLWQVSDGRLSKTTSLSTGFVHSLAFSPDGHILAAGCYDGAVRLWRVADGQLVRVLEGHTNFVLSVAFSPDGQKIAAGGGSTNILVWRTRDGRLFDTLRGHTNFVRSIAFCQDGQTLASGSEDKTVRLWRVRDGSSLHILHEHTSGVLSVAFSPDGHILASGSRDTKIRLWRAL